MKKVVIHLSPLGTKSQNISEFLNNKKKERLPHYIIGMQNSEIEVINTCDLNKYNNSNSCGVGLYGTYDRESIDIVICLPQIMDDDKVLIDDSNSYFENTRELLIKTISEILKITGIGIDSVLSHKEAYEYGMAQDRRYYIENWWDMWHGFYNMNYLRSDIQTYIDKKIVMKNESDYVKGNILPVKSYGEKIDTRQDKTIFRIILPNTVFTDSLISNLQGINYNPVPLLFFTDGPDSTYYPAIQLYASVDVNLVNKKKDELIKYGYPKAIITINDFTWDEDIENCMKSENMNQLLQDIMKM